MKKYFSLFVAVCMLSIMQTWAQTPTISWTFDETGVAITVTPEDSRVFFVSMPTEYLGDPTASAEAIISEYLAGYDFETFEAYLPQGSSIQTYEDWGIEAGVPYSFLAAVVEWDGEKAVLASTALRKDTTFAAQVSIELTETEFTVSATPETSSILFVAGPTEDIDTEDYTAEEFFAGYLEYIESADDIESYAFVGPFSTTYQDYFYKGIETDAQYTFLAATIAWDAAEGKAVLTSDLVRKDKVLVSSGDTEAPEEPEVPTIDPAIYYIYTLSDGENYYATCLAETATLGALQVINSATPRTADNEFTFAAVEGKQAVFTIQDRYGRYLFLTDATVEGFQVSTTLPAAGAEWKVELKAYPGYCTITNTATKTSIRYNADSKTYICQAGELELADMPVLTKAKDIPSALIQTEQAPKPLKVIENGQLVIIKDGIRYNVMGIQF